MDSKIKIFSVFVIIYLFFISYSEAQDVLPLDLEYEESRYEVFSKLEVHGLSGLVNEVLDDVWHLSVKNLDGTKDIMYLEFSDRGLVSVSIMKKGMTRNQAIKNRDNLLVDIEVNKDLGMKEYYAEKPLEYFLLSDNNYIIPYLFSGSGKDFISHVVYSEKEYWESKKDKK